MDVDELWSFVGTRKNAVWIWGEVCRETKRVLSQVIGGRDEATAARLWKQLEHRLKGACRETTACRPVEVYTAVVPPAQFVQSKAETHTIEGQNSLIRHCLARFKRKSFSDSKSVLMLQYSLNLFLYWRNH